MAKPSVYIETTIAGHLTSRLPKDIVVVAQMLTTRAWWDHSRSGFDCFTSQRVLEEAGRGDPVAAAERLSAIATLPILRIGDAAVVQLLADQLVARSALPPKARVDALHLAIAATSGMDYLLTWNCKHLANASTRATIEWVCRDRGFEPPVICTPAELNEVSS